MDSSICSPFPTLDGTGVHQLLVVVRCKSTTNVVSNPDSAPLYKIYSQTMPATPMASGTLSNAHTGTITGAANNGSGLVRITCAAHGLETGDYVTVQNVTGTTEANGTWPVTKISSSTFDLVGSAFASAYVSGGDFYVTGLRAAQVSISTGAGFSRGDNYFVVVTYAVSSNQLSEIGTFVVI